MGDPDGTLLDWRDIESEYDWDTLLLGNGLSINVWDRFAYRELYERAQRGSVLTPVDRRLFRQTPNFERVLADLLTAIRVDACLERDSAPLYACYKNIQVALGHAVRRVHVSQGRIPTQTLSRIRAEMERFEWVFTTSYDLLAYWAMACENDFDPFVDLFRGNRLEFDPRAWIPPKRVPVLFLHGALHLVVGSSGRTWKLRRTGLDTLLSQFGQPIAGDDRARPLLVTEGSAADKLAAIEDNVYLAYALERLNERELPVVVFGSSLGEHDSHITEALSENPGRPVAISMLPAPKKELLARQADIFGRLDAQPLIFYDARSHPLGDPALAVRGGA